MQRTRHRTIGKKHLFANFKQIEEICNMLTAKQEQFCQEYLIDLNATQAAIRAGYSEETARSIGSENLSKPDIQERLSQLNLERQEATGINQKRVLEEIAKIAFSDVGVIFDTNGALLAVHDIDEQHRGVISSVKVYEEKAAFGEETITQGVTKEVKLWDKMKALEMLSKHIGLFEKDNTQRKADNPDPSIISALADRLNK